MADDDYFDWDAADPVWIADAPGAHPVVPTGLPPCEGANETKEDIGQSDRPAAFIERRQKNGDIDYINVATWQSQWENPSDTSAGGKVKYRCDAPGESCINIETGSALSFGEVRAAEQNQPSAASGVCAEQHSEHQQAATTQTMMSFMMTLSQQIEELRSDVSRITRRLDLHFDAEAMMVRVLKTNLVRITVLVDQGATVTGVGVLCVDPSDSNSLVVATVRHNLSRLWKPDTNLRFSQGEQAQTKSLQATKLHVSPTLDLAVFKVRRPSSSSSSSTSYATQQQLHIATHPPQLLQRIAGLSFDVRQKQKFPIYALHGYVEATDNDHCKTHLTTTSGNSGSPLLQVNVSTGNVELVALHKGGFPGEGAETSLDSLEEGEEDAADDEGPKKAPLNEQLAQSIHAAAKDPGAGGGEVARCIRRIARFTATEAVHACRLKEYESWPLAECTHTPTSFVLKGPAAELLKSPEQDHSLHCCEEESDTDAATAPATRRTSFQRSNNQSPAPLDFKTDRV